MFEPGGEDNGIVDLTKLGEILAGVDFFFDLGNNQVPYNIGRKLIYFFFLLWLVTGDW